MIKLLASDLDGTLLKNNIVSRDNELALKNLNLSKNIFAISTGRPYNAVEFLYDDYDFNIDYSILLNGALILDKYKNILHHKVLDFDLVCDVLDYIKQYNPSISLDTGFESYNLDGRRTYLVENNRFKIYNLNQVDKKKLSLISLYFEDLTDNEIESIYNNLNSMYSSKLNIFRNSKYIDLVSPNCSKGNSIKLICDIENVDFKNIYTIGDSYNDIPMFNSSYNSFTFDYAASDVKNMAKHIVSSVSSCINDYILKR